MPRLFPRIEIDHSKCTVPLVCNQCMRVCPEVVFALRVQKVERGKETNPEEPGAYRLEAPRRDKCTVCDLCVQVCPVGAIAIALPQGAPVVEGQRTLKGSPAGKSLADKRPMTRP